MEDALVKTIEERLGGRGDDDQPARISPAAQDLVLAACRGPGMLDAVLAGEPLPQPVAGPGETGRAGPATRGVFLESVSVRGFRGIGQEATLHFHPGPGLTVVSGRNGSGKSTFAEGLEVLLTGTAPRFEKVAVFRNGWRNLHDAEAPRLSARLAVEGVPDGVAVTRSWASATAIGGGTAAGLYELGWGDDLVTYRPFLAHSELEAMLTGKPSELHDRIAVVLGLDALAETQKLLTDRRLAVERLGKAAKRDRDALLAALTGVDDDRARACHTELSSRTPALESLRALATGVGDTATQRVLVLLRELASLTVPAGDRVAHVADTLRAAAVTCEAVAGSDASRARHTATLLVGALDLHAAHPDQTACPVCGRAAALDDAWRQQVADEVARLTELARSAAAAQGAEARAFAAVADLVGRPPRAVVDRLVLDDVDLAGVTGAWQAWVEAGCVDLADVARAKVLRQTADALDAAIGPLAAAVASVRHDAAAALQRRENLWAPLAARVAAWADGELDAVTVRRRLSRLREAEKWLKATSESIRNDRLAPIAARAQEIWRSLRQESNVDLEGIALVGTAGQRRVRLDVTVDGCDSSALGVMSQGEINALALSLFLPRAGLSESPFRFVVIDDPVQSMDAAKVDGLARVLVETARARQVVVFTHDDRLAAALRRLDVRATLLEVKRRPGSVVTVVPNGDPASQRLGGAHGDRTIDDARRSVRDTELLLDSLDHAGSRT